MKNGNPRLLSGMVVLFLMIAACVIPGQTLPPAPTIDPGAVGTSIAATVQAAQSQTAIAQNPLVALPTGMTGTLIEQAADGSAKYTDYDGGFEIAFPAGWLALRPNSEEFDAALANEGTVNSMLYEQMTADQAGYEAGFDRLFSYVLRPDIQKDVLFGFSKLSWDSEDAVFIDNFTMGKLVKELEGSGGIPGFRANVVQLREDTAVRMIEIGGRWSMSDGQGGGVPFYSTVIFFKPTPDSLARLTFTYLQDYEAQISADVRSIIASIKLLEP